MTYPDGLTLVTVRHKIAGTSGRSMPGYATATLTGRLWTGKGSVVPTEYKVPREADGSYEFKLPPVDHPLISRGQGEAYLITEYATAPGRTDMARVVDTFHIAPLMQHAPTPVDASEMLAPRPAPGGGITYMTGPATPDSMADVASDPNSEFNRLLKGTIAAETPPIAEAAGRDAAITVLADQPAVVDAAATRALSVEADPAMADAVDTDGSLVRQALTRTGSKPVGRNELAFNIADYAPPSTDSDQSAAIQDCIDAATAAGGKVVGHGTWRIDQRITITCDADLGEVNLHYYGTGTAVRIGQKADDQPLFRPIITAPRVRNMSKTALGWDGTSIGIDCWNVNSGVLTIPYVHDFNVGVRMYGNVTGTSYTTVIPGWFVNNKTNMLFDSAAGGGYATQIVVLGGRMSHSHAEGTNIPGVANVRTQGPGDGGPNNLTFVGTCLEGAQAQYAIDIEGGRFNQFLNCRLEYVHAIRFGPGAIRNKVDGGYHAIDMRVVREAGSQLNTVNGLLGTEFADHVRIRRDGEAFDWVHFDRGTKRLYLGPGSVQAPIWLSAGTAGLVLGGGRLQPDTDGSRDLGGSGARWRNVYLSSQIYLGTNIILRAWGNDLQKSVDGGTTWTTVG